MTVPLLLPGLAGSSAVRADGRVRLHVELPRLLDRPDAGSALRLRNGDVQVDSPVTASPSVEGHLLVAESPHDRIGPGAWQLLLRLGREGDFQPVGAHLLVPPLGPLSLLLGDPAQAALPSQPATTRERLVRRIAHHGDHVLALLGTRRAEAARTWVRGAGRRSLD